MSLVDLFAQGLLAVLLLVTLTLEAASSSLEDGDEDDDDSARSPWLLFLLRTITYEINHFHDDSAIEQIKVLI